jgi:hypothetical protein
LGAKVCDVKDVYLLRYRGEVLCIADDFDRVSMQMSSYPAIHQSEMTIENHNLLEEGD